MSRKERLNSARHKLELLEQAADDMAQQIQYLTDERRGVLGQVRQARRDVLAIELEPTISKLTDEQRAFLRDFDHEQRHSEAPAATQLGRKRLLKREPSRYRKYWRLTAKGQSVRDILRLAEEQA